MPFNITSNIAFDITYFLDWRNLGTVDMQKGSLFGIQGT